MDCDPNKNVQIKDVSFTGTYHFKMQHIGPSPFVVLTELRSIFLHVMKKIIGKLQLLVIWIFCLQTKFILNSFYKGSVYCTEY